jgi:UDP-glucose 4-epimerase
MTRVLVTGGAGFIGSHLVDRLLADGHEVTVVDDLSTGKILNLAQARRDPNLPLAFQRLDVTSTGLERAVAKAAPDVVFHLAAQIDVRKSVADPVQDAVVNVVGTVNLLEACARHGVSKVVHTSSGGCIYGEPAPADLPVPEDYPGHPASPYGASKRGVEEYLHAYATLYGLRWTSLALGNVYGPRQDPAGEAGVVSIFAGRMLADAEVTVYGDGEQTRDFVYVADVVDAYLAAIDRADGLRVNIGTAVATTVNELYAILAEFTGYRREPEHAPPRDGELRHIALDVGRAADVLGWKPRHTLREGLAATVDWLRG